MAIAKGIYDVLNQAALTALLGTHNSRPCIFSVFPAPGSAPRPYVQFSAPERRTLEPDKDGRRSDADIALNIVSDNLGSQVAHEAIEAQVIALCTAGTFTIDGQTAYINTIDGPVQIPSDDKVIATQATLRLQWKE